MLKVNDRVKFTGAPPHKEEVKDWAKEAGLEQGETYTVFSVEPSCIRLEGFKFWHYAGRFELVKPEEKDKKGGKDEKV